MALVIYDQGYRIQTPVESLFKQRGVESMQQSSHASGLPASEDKAQRQQGTEERIELSRERFQLPNQPGRAPHKGYEQPSESTNSSASSKAQGLHASQVMSSPVLTIRAETSLRQAWELMQAQEVYHLILVDDNERALGILSRNDILERGTDSPISVTQAYRKQMIVASPTTPVSSIAASFVRYDIGAIPVIDDQDRLQGIVCRTDLLRMLINNAHIESWA
ncbi:HPP family protein [Marinobacterium stanieri]|uniref:CBS domain-containing protein n=1 Tax=Marinobacterium stanieri TaxID=49186 RepID=UPI003A90681D